jgi:uncharacterized protein
VGKLAFWFIVIVGGLIVARLLARQAGKESQPRPVRQAAPRSGSRNTPETMVRCAHCGIHLPRSEALLVGGKTWCSKEHAKLGAPQ